MNSDLVGQGRAAQMTKKVMGVVKMKKPCMRKGGMVAKRAIKKPFESKKHKKHKKKAVRPIAPVSPCRLKCLNDRKRKHDTDKRWLRKLAQADRHGGVVDRFFTSDYLPDDRNILLGVEISVTVGHTEHRVSMCDSVTGDNGLPDDK